jgi:hypothetical protein
VIQVGNIHYRRLLDIFNVQILLIFVLEVEKLAKIGALKMGIAWGVFAIVLMDIMEQIVLKFIVQQELISILLLRLVLQFALVVIIKINMIPHVKSAIHHANNAIKNQLFALDAYLLLKILNIFIIPRTYVIVFARQGLTL